MSIIIEEAKFVMSEEQLEQHRSFVEQLTARQFTFETSLQKGTCADYGVKKTPLKEKTSS